MSSNFHRLFKNVTGKTLLPAVFGFSLLASAGASSATPDVLQAPAFETDKAADSLLLDIENLGSRIVAVGARGHIIYSDDRGANWTQADVPVSVMLTSVDFATSEKGWAVGHSGVILHSNDAGVTWLKQFDGNQANQSTVDQARAYVAELEFELDEAGGEDEDLEYAIEDAEYAIEDAELDAEIGASKPFLDVLFVDDKHGFAVGAYGFLFETKNGGQTWTNRSDALDNLDRFHLNTIAQLPGGNIVVAGEAGVMFVSKNVGKTWAVIDSPYEGSFFGLVGLSNKGAGLAFGLRGNLFRTDNGGFKWRKLDSNTQDSLMSGSYDGGNKVSITGNAGVVIVSKDGGKTFSSYSREDRLGHTSLVYITRQRVALVGESGVELVSPSGKNL